MTLAAFPMVLAATAALEPVGETSTSLGVTATVVRGVQISSPTIRADRAVVTVRNATGVEVQVAGATADRVNPGMTNLTSDGGAPVVITLVY